MENAVKVVQCWNDGVTSDVRLIEILRRHGARATFNLNAGLHERVRQPMRIYLDTQVARLAWDEMRDVYDGFTIASHSLTHPSLEKAEAKEARADIAEGRERLQQFFDRPVRGFAYPYGSHNQAVMEIVREAGHLYARTTVNVDCPFPPENAMAFHPSCHFRAPDFWLRYENAKKCGVFYFWGHSYEMVSEDMWTAFEEKIAKITADPESCWGNVEDLFSNAAPAGN